MKKVMTTYAQPDVEEEEDEEEDGALTPQGVHLSLGPAGWSPLVPHAPLLTIPTHTRAHEHTHTIRLHSRQSPFPFPRNATFAPRSGLGCHR